MIFHADRLKPFFRVDPPVPDPPEPSGAGYIVRRNYTEDDDAYYAFDTDFVPTLPDPDDIGWPAPSGKTFREWNSLRDGTGTISGIGDTPAAFAEYYAVWQDAVTVEYLTTNHELKSVADAIRSKGGTPSSLVYPSGFVSAIGAIRTGVDVSDTTAAASDVRTGRYFYNSLGEKTQGTVPIQAAQTIMPGTATQTIPGGRILTGTQVIPGDANLAAENIRSGVTIFGVTGTYEGGGSMNVMTLYAQTNASSVLNNTLYLDSARTQDLTAYYNYDYEAVYNALKGADVIEIYGTYRNDKHFVIALEYDRTDESIRLGVGFNGAVFSLLI